MRKKIGWRGPGRDLAHAEAALVEWERQDYHEALEGVRRGYADMQAGRTKPAEEAFEELRLKQGLPR